MRRLYPGSARRRPLVAAALVLGLLAVAGGLVAVGRPGVQAGPSPAPGVEPPRPQASVPPSTAAAPSVTPSARSGWLRVYSNNIENLVYNNPDRSCTEIAAADHLDSMLVDNTGVGATDSVRPPDLLLLQQVMGAEQAKEYADATASRFGYPSGTYGFVVAVPDPVEWGYTHDCRQRELGRRKGRQTNAILYNTRTLELTAAAEPWSAGWLPPRTAYAGGRGCRAYEPPYIDRNPARRSKWQRTTAIAARFRIQGTTTDVFAASLHLPRQNLRTPCAGPGDTGMSGSGIRLSPDALKLMKGTELRAVGVDANRTRLADDILAGYGLTGHGEGRTMPRSKIDYLFLRGEVLSSPVGHTITGTLSNHLALYAFLEYRDR